MSADERADVELALLGEIRAFLDELNRCQPQFDDGLVHSVLIEGAVAGHADDGHALYRFRVTREQESEL